MSTPCKQCEARAAEWLTQYQEQWLGPKEKWTKKEKNMWSEYFGIISLFARDFHFPDEHTHKPRA